MTTRAIKLDSMSKVQDFVHVINEYSGHFDLVSGCSKVNARSIMGIFSLDISKPIILNIDSEDSDKVLIAIKPFL